MTQEGSERPLLGEKETAIIEYVRRKEMAYTVTAPNKQWLGQSEVNTLDRAMRRKAAWAFNQNAHAIILDEDGFIVSSHEQNKYLAGYTE